MRQSSLRHQTNNAHLALPLLRKYGTSARTLVGAVLSRLERAWFAVLSDSILSFTNCPSSIWLMPGCGKLLSWNATDEIKATEPFKQRSLLSLVKCHCSIIDLQTRAQWALQSESLACTQESIVHTNQSGPIFWVHLARWNMSVSVTLRQSQPNALLR